MNLEPFLCTPLNGENFPEELPEGEIHVWIIDINQPNEILQQYLRFLSKKELSTYSEFLFEMDKRTFLASHGSLRYILSKYLKKQPHSIILKKTIFGKPEIITDQYIDNIQFSLCHSKEIALIALNKDAIGVDVEYLKRKINHSKMAKTFLSNCEYKKYLRLKPDQRQMMFLKHWVSKEAATKVIGVPDSLITKTRKYQLTTEFFSPKQSYIGAIASNQKKEVKFYKFSGSSI